MAKVDTDKESARKFGSGFLAGTLMGLGIMAAKRRHEHKKSGLQRLMDQIDSRL